MDIKNRKIKSTVSSGHAKVDHVKKTKTKPMDLQNPLDKKIWTIS